MFSDTGEHEWKIHRSLYFSYINQYFFGTQRGRQEVKFGDMHKYLM